MSFNASENEYILAIFKIQTPLETFILYKFHNSSFYTNCSGIYPKSLYGMSLILTLLENDLPFQVLCLDFKYNFSYL